MVTKIENVPEELKGLKQWVCWVGADKLPKNPATGGNAMSNNSDTWGSFEQAVKAVDTFGFDGIGFMFANGYFGVDLDHVLDNTDFVDEFVETLQSLWRRYSHTPKSVKAVMASTSSVEVHCQRAREEVVVLRCTVKADTSSVQATFTIQNIHRFVIARKVSRSYTANTFLRMCHKLKQGT